MASINSGTSGRPTGNVYVDTLVWGGSWAPALGEGAVLNFAVRSSSTQFPTQTWTSSEVSALEAALQTWANVADLKFTSDGSKAANLVFYKVSDAVMTQIAAPGVLGFQKTPDGSTVAPLDGVFNGDAFSTANLTPGADGFLTLVHELGHGLGLAHPHDGGGSGELFPGVTSSSALGTNALNQQIYTVMSYNVGWVDEPSGSLLYGESLGPMALDIAAIQAIYGANTSYNTGNQTYSLVQSNGSGTGWNCLWDAGGADTISNAGSNQACVIDLREAPLTGANAGGYVSWVGGVAGGFTIANGAVIENAIGGNLGDDLVGNAANNLLDGGGGADFMEGGDGSDTYVVDHAADVISETNGGASGGTDLVQSSVTFSLGTNLDNLLLTGNAAINGTGNELDNLLTGNAAANTLIGGGGNDTLTASGGADLLEGGQGDDIYYVSDATASLTEAAGEGTDQVFSSVSIALSANVEHLTLTGTQAIDGTGNAEDNILVGNAAANVLDGGSGSDQMAGGEGDDTYVVDSGSDSVSESSNSGTDLVRSSIAYTLGNHLENLTLFGSADIDATGNALDNTLTGNIGANVLDGGSGTDVLQGAAGDDTYYVDVTASRVALVIQDSVVEGLNSGSDTVILRSAAAIALGAATTLTASDHVENYDASALGTTLINLTGNTRNNLLIGNAAANVLDGGAGVDTLNGGDGNDTYIIDSSDDVIIETKSSAIGGTDAVKAAVSYVLGDNLEKLTLTGLLDIDGTGNDLDNTLVGNSGDNVLDGGVGIDALQGGLGDDTYHVDITLNDDLVLVAEDAVAEAKDAGSDSIIFRVASPLVLDKAATLTVVANIEGYDISALETTLINLAGNTLNNRLIGNAVANTLDGASGADYLDGADGDDIYVVDNEGDQVVESNAAAEGGTDMVLSAVSYTLGTNLENLTLTGKGAINGTGNAVANILIGNDAINTLTGGDGDDILNGGAKSDLMVGGAGNDTYYVDSKLDLISEQTGEGTDNVFASATYILAANVENLTLTGSMAVNGTGNTLSNTLIGNSASNVLDGGTGADILVGGDGNDTYIVDSLGDIVMDTNAGFLGGLDTVKSAVSYVLGDNLERLTLTGLEDANGTGNTLDNTILGNSGANALDGGEGVDTLSGGAGNDTYIVDLWVNGRQVQFQDKVNELRDGGTDMVVFRSTTPLSLETAATLTVVANFEGYDLSGTGSAMINLTGNALRNTMVGNNADNYLDGLAGADVMTGGGGNDTYVVDNLGDSVTEADASPAGGIDLVRSSLSYVLGANLENLTLIGRSVINGRGNALDNEIIGNSLANILNGDLGNDRLAGGAGNDTLTGGAGADKFIFDVVPRLRGNTDSITDFDLDADKIVFDTSVFIGLRDVASIGAENLVIGTKAADADDYLIYNAGTLYYDADGTGQVAAAPVATLVGTPALDYTHFLLES